MRELFVGLDIGTTSIKGSVVDENDQVLHTASVPTRWLTVPPGATALDVAALYAGVDAVLAEAASIGEIRGIGITGMAETGALLDDSGEPVWPAMAWHDPHGDVEAAKWRADEPEFAADFSWRTGLPLDSQASVVKVKWLCDTYGGAERGRCWLSIPELVAKHLTGVEAAERSLLSRTGFFDHSSHRIWDDAVRLAGLDAAVLPPVKSAGEPWGVVATGPVAGAVVTVAGHDHLVAAVGAGVDEAGEIFNSCGTADVIVRVVDQWPSREDFLRLAPLNTSLGHHPIAGHYAVNAGTKAGFVLGRLTHLIGDLPDEVPLVDGSEAARVVLPSFGDDELSITLRGNATTEHVWASAFDALVVQAITSVALVSDVFGPATDVFCGGGWTRVAAVRALKRRIFGECEFISIQEPGCLGAVLLARRAVQDHLSTPDHDKEVPAQ